MLQLRALIGVIDSFTDTTGRYLAWLALGMALLTALVVLLRYGFNIGSIAAQEAVTYMHGSLFILGMSWNYVAESWAIRETSPEPGGIPAVFLLKTLLLLLPLLLILQGIAELLRNTLFLMDPESERHK